MPLVGQPPKSGILFRPDAIASLEGDGSDQALLCAIRKAKSWRTPPHWSSDDWHVEVRAIAHSAAACARLDFDRQRAVPLRAHIYMRAVAAAWTRYRQEWSYYLHSVAEPRISVEPEVTPVDTHRDDRTIHSLLGQALKKLSPEDHWLIEQLFWKRAHQRRIANTLHISQQHVSRRKARVLRQLRRVLNSQSEGISHLVTLYWVVLDSLDLLPGIGLL